MTINEITNIKLEKKVVFFSFLIKKTKIRYICVITPIFVFTYFIFLLYSMTEVKKILSNHGNLEKLITTCR
jgi:hypothetical protein